LLARPWCLPARWSGWELDLSKAQLYKLIGLYRANPRTATLVRRKNGVKAGQHFLDEEREAIIRREIDDFYLKTQKPKASQLVKRIQHACHAAGIKPPSKNTVINRVAQIPAEQKLRAREGDKAADNKFRPVVTSFESDRPLGMVQIDHTRMDVFVVDEAANRSAAHG
jgi:putative transposase